MEFLKEILGEELYEQFSAAVNAYNENPDNKDKNINLANLASGEYVSKGKYAAALSEKGNLEEQLKTLNGTIATLKSANKDNEALQSTIATLQADLKNQQAESVKIAKTYALKEQLSKEGVLDPDYLIYKAGGLEKFNFDKENLPVGVSDVVKSYKENDTMSYLFKQEKKTSYNPAGGGAGIQTNPFAKETFNLTKQGELLKSNPEAAKQMAAEAGISI